MINFIFRLGNLAHSGSQYGKSTSSTDTDTYMFFHLQIMAWVGHFYYNTGCTEGFLDLVVNDLKL
jgi:hypothetical protein